MDEIFNAANYQYNQLAILTIFSAIIILALGVYILFHGQRKIENRSFFIATLMISLWLFGTAMCESSRNSHLALFWSKRLGFIGVSFIGASVYLFIVSILNQFQKHKRRIFTACLISLVFYLLANSTTFLISGVRLTPFGYYNQYGGLGILFIAYFMVLLIYSLMLLVSDLKDTADDLKRKQMGLFLVAMLFGYTGSIDYLPCFGFDIYPFGYISVLIFVFIAVFAIAEYGFLVLDPGMALPVIFDAVTNFIIGIDNKNRIIFANRFAYEVFGHEAEIVGQPVEKIFGEKEKFHQMRDRISDINRGLFTREEDSYFLTKDGRKVLVNCNLSPVWDKRHKTRVLGFVLTATDITERKRAEEELRKHRDHLEELVKERTQALRESEEKYRMMFETAKDAVFLSDKTGKFVDVNQVACESLGYSKEELLKLSVKEIDADPRGYEAFLKIRNESEGQISFEVNQRGKDGTLLPVEITGSFFTSGGQRIAVAIARDITERKQAEKALRNSEERLARAVEGNSIPTFLIDGNHFITHWNKACENLTGFSASEVVGTKKQWSAFYIKERPVMADFIVDGSTEEEMAECYKHIDYNKSVLIEGAYEAENFYPDLGEKGKWLFFTAAPLRDQQGKIVGAIETFLDVTERRSMEEQLRQALKMEAIGTLAGGIAHDFNNLLTVIIGNAQLALMDVIKDESLRKKIEEIMKAGDKAASLAIQLLAFSRKQIIKPEVLDINEEINEMGKMLKRMIGEDIELQTVFEPGLWKVYADSGQIDQVIMNMVVNARDAISTCADSAAGRPQERNLTIETANADLDENYFREHGIKETPGPYVMLAVSDTGSGMDKETREHIFEPFFTTKEVGKGTGLGLSTVYGIVKQGNGFIWVYSEPGKGTTFKIYLPKVKGDAEPEEKEQTPVDDLGGSETVLIVEDDNSLRKFAQEVLRSYGYRILAAENGEDALRVSQAHEGQIDLMITDVVMPKMGGKEAADRLQPLYPQMKVIYMSGYTDNAIVHHGVLSSELSFLEKPFTPEALARKVREVLGAGKIGEE